MASQPQSPHVVRFGLFEADLQTRELRKRGIRLKVHEQTFQLLGALLERPGDIITRDELRQKLWPDETFVDFDHGINTAVKKLREALGDTADNPRFVETIARRGYRFLAPVNGAANDAGASKPTSPAAVGGDSQHLAISQISSPAVAASFSRRERVGWIAAACLFAALVALAIVHVQLRQAPEARAVQFEVALPKKDVVSPVISPDGQYVAFATGDRIWLHSLNSLTTNPLPGTEGGDLPFWSPDSRQIGFTTGSALKKVSLTGGAPRTICNLGACGAGPSAWSRDGVILFCRGFGQPLYEVSAAGGEPRALTKLDRSHGQTAHFFPSFLPDQRHFIYLSEGSKPGTYLGSLDSPEVKRIHEGSAHAVYAPPGYLIFMGFPSLMAERFDVRKAELTSDPVQLADSVGSYDEWGYGLFSVSENGVLTYFAGPDPAGTQLAWFDRTGTRLGTVGEPADYSNPAISPDQNKVAVAKRDPQTKTRDIWVIDLHGGASSRLTFDPGDDTDAAWSPDSTRIAFSSNRNGPRDIFVKSASGAGDEQMVVQSRESKYINDWSPDGQHLLYEIADTEEWLFSLSEHKAVPLLRSSSVLMEGRFSPSHRGPPRWVAYTSEETGLRQVYVRSLAGALSGSGAKWQISTGGGIEPYWRGDARELFYLNGNKLMAAELNPYGEILQAGTPKELFETRLANLGRNGYDVTLDGNRFLMNVPVGERERTSFRVVLNWPALLKR